MEKDAASTMLAVTQQLRTHWSGMITAHFGFVLTTNVAIWSYLGKSYVDSFTCTGSEPVFLYLASAISAVYLGLWRFYTRYIDDHLANLYPDFLLYEGTIGVPPERGTSGYLSKEMPQIKDLLNNNQLSLEKKVTAISLLVSKKRIGRRGHLGIDVSALIVISILLVVSFVIMFKNGSFKEWFLLIANLIGLVFVILALVCFQKNPCEQQLSEVRRKISEQSQPSS